MPDTVQVFLVIYRNRLQPTTRVGPIYATFAEAWEEALRVEAMGHTKARIIDRTLDLRPLST